MPGNGSIGFHGLAVDHRILDAATVRKVMAIFNYYIYDMIFILLEKLILLYYFRLIFDCSYAFVLFLVSMVDWFP